MTEIIRPGPFSIPHFDKAFKNDVTQRIRPEGMPEGQRTEIFA